MIEPNIKGDKKFPFQLILNLGFAVILVFLIYRSFKEEDKIVYINTPKLLLEYKGMQDVQNSYNNKMKDFKIKADTLLAEVKVIAENLKNNGSKMSKKSIEENQYSLKFKEKQLNNFVQAMKKRIEDEDNKNRDLVIKDINAYVLEYAKSQNYRYVFGAKPDGTIIHANETLDITDLVLVGLNKNYVRLSQNKR